MGMQRWLSKGGYPEMAMKRWLAKDGYAKGGNS